MRISHTMTDWFPLCSILNFKQAFFWWVLGSVRDSRENLQFAAALSDTKMMCQTVSILRKLLWQEVYFIELTIVA